MKKIDVILASYNGEEFIEEQINSILLNFNKISDYSCRLLISDDCSHDKTIEIIRLASISDDRIYLIDINKKGGVRQNFNFLINISDADYIFFSDQDDFWLPNKINIFMKKFSDVEKTNNGPILIHSDLSVVDKDLSPINTSMFNYQKINKNPIFSELLVSNSITGCVMACNKALLDNIRKKSIEESIMHDWYIGLYASAFGAIFFIDKPLILYRQHDNNQVGAKSFNFFDIINFNAWKNKLSQIRESILKTKYQAELFFFDFGDKLDFDKKIIISKYIESFEGSFLMRFILFKKNKIKKFGILRNIIFFLMYVCKLNNYVKS
jgi:glycosyltransferase involved in cell wall biosynthesis